MRTQKFCWHYILPVPPAGFSRFPEPSAASPLRPYGLIRRKDKTHRYELTPQGLKTALFYSRLIRPGLSLLHAPIASAHGNLNRAFHRFEGELQRCFDQQKAA